MPVRVDHAQRRVQLAEAMWAIIARDGMAAASVRGVARQAGLSMGSIRHFFGTQDELLQFAMREVIVRARQRVTDLRKEREALVSQGAAPQGAVRLLEEVLPLDEERLTEARVWMALSSHGSTDVAMLAIRHEADDAVRAMCHTCLGDLVQIGRVRPDLDLEIETERLWALLDGLATHIVFNSEHTSPDLAARVLHAHLASLEPNGAAVNVEAVG